MSEDRRLQAIDGDESEEREIKKQLTKEELRDRFVSREIERLKRWREEQEARNADNFTEQNMVADLIKQLQKDMHHEGS